MSARWSQYLAPDLGDFESLVGDIFKSLPPEFRTRCQGIAIQVQDFPSEDVAEQLGLQSLYDLLGLYQGVDLTRKSVADPGAEPDMVFLFRRPIIDQWAEGEDTLGSLVAHVLIHEIGHHFGLSDDDMEAIEAAVEEAA